MNTLFRFQSTIDDQMKPFLFFLFFYLCLCYTSARDTLRPNQTLLDNGQTLISANGTFELGFFNPIRSTTQNRYIGIWFKNVTERTVVWVANRNNPITNSSSTTHFLSITETGNVVILGNSSPAPIWSSNSSAKNPTLQLLETGNLVVRNGDESGNISWQSFDHPVDTQIAGMKVGWDFRTGQNWRLNTWTSLEDPATGRYTYEVDTRIPQLVQRSGEKILYRSGPWDGVRFGGDPPMVENPLFRPSFIYKDTHVYYTFENIDKTASRLWVSPEGSIQQLRWNRASSSWIAIVVSLERDECDSFQRCGPNGFCDTNQGAKVCYCPRGFVPRALQDWTRLDPSSGCMLRMPLNCSAAGVLRFGKFSGLKLPYGTDILVRKSVVRREECEAICRANCSCVAYSVARVVGCVLWYGDLLDVRIYKNGGQDLYVKMAASEFESKDDTEQKTVIISVSIVSGCLMILLLVICLGIIGKRNRCSQDEEQNSILHEEDIELPSFSMDIIANATNKFCDANKIGEGGFGAVYKGILQNGQQIAVKRLSKDSGQGLIEFKNEVILISKLQHRNLVKLLGCCIHRDERMLIYEYMPNKSLNLYIFNKSRSSAVLDWQRRFNIILGIARGLLYLHRDSRLRIIHRDLKASNILLDNDMNPKISDFGLARIFGGDQTQVKTKRVVGTYGYMSPEYAIDGKFSMKSDIFSFGVMVLEIISGNKNRGFQHPDHELNLLGHAWKLWNEEKGMELIDALIEKVSVCEVLRCVQVGLLCVQKRPEDRPLMSSILFMLESSENSLLQPKQPGFYMERVPSVTHSVSSLNKSRASTELTITNMDGR